MTIEICSFSEITPPSLDQRSGTPAVAALKEGNGDAGGLVEEFSEFHGFNVLVAARSMETWAFVGHMLESL